MAKFYSSRNTQWQQDNTGAYIEFAQNTNFIEVSINFENQLRTGEVIDSVVTQSDHIDINATFPFFLTGREGNYQLAVIQFDLLDNDPGVYPVNITVTTNQNRTYQRHFRVRIV
jgi:hypothetical protein